MIKLHKVISSSSDNARSVWVNPATIHYISEWHKNDRSGAAIHFTGETVMVKESRAYILSMLGYIDTGPEEDPTDTDMEAMASAIVAKCRK